MINYFRKKRQKKRIVEFEKQILNLLEDQFEDLFENHQHWQLDFFMFNVNGDRSIQLLHRSNDVKYVNKNRKKHNKSFKIEGLKVWNITKSDFENFEVSIYQNTIQIIKINYVSDLLKEFDFNNLELGNIKTETLVIHNEDKEKVDKLINGLSSKDLAKLEIDDTFEIELNNKKYFTIIDLEDGNYIAIDKSKKVYRLIHDHEEPVKMINKRLDDFVIEYNGNKDSLNKFIDE